MTALVWFRRDLRSFDHAALRAALRRHDKVYCAFVFDRVILDPLPRTDRRVEFILRAVEELDAVLRTMGGALIVRHGDARDAVPQLAAELGVTAVYANRDYEPAVRERDTEVARRLASADFLLFRDQVIFECDEILTRAGRPFSVFTPYKQAWLKALQPAHLAPHAVEPVSGKLARPPFACRMPTLAELGFAPTDLAQLGIPVGMSGARALFEAFKDRIDAYAERRDYPALVGPSYLSAHLRFGTISIRQLAGYAHARMLASGSRGASTWLSELIWRDFYQMVLWQRPDVTDHAFNARYDDLVWDEAPELLSAWRAGLTGYPLVDAAMRQLDATGYMHNRLRMVAASFLTKDLGVDWRRGADHFALKLLDFDLAANNGGWQWAASTGCDAQPWFRIFNPVMQSEKFDPHGEFIRSFVPELATVPDRHIHAPWRMTPQQQSECGVAIGRDYPLPVVDHALARQRTLDRFGRLRTA